MNQDSSQTERRRTRADRFRWYWKFTNRLEAFEVRAFGNSGFGIVLRRPVLMLQTTGRRTRRRHRVVVAYLTDGDRIVIGGGAAGMTRVDWVANLRANAEAVIFVGRERREVVARELRGAEEDAAREQAFARFPGAWKYERSGRRIPYFRLDPR